MGWLDTISSGFNSGMDWLGDNKDTISTVGNLALGGYGLYQSGKAAETASNFYDAAGETAKQRWDLIKSLEKAKVDAETQMLAQRGEWDMDLNELYSQHQQTSLNNQILEYQNALMPWMMDRSNEIIRFQNEMMPAEQDLYRSQTALQQQAFDSSAKDIEQYEQYRGIDDAYYQQAMEGIDPGREADRAQADVAHAFAGTMEAANRALARRGVGPDSAGYQGQVTANAIEQAKAVGSARTGARKYAEDVNYNRLGSAMNARQRLAPATTGAVTAPSATILPRQTPVSFSGGTSTMNANSADPTNTYLALGNAAANGANASSFAGWDLIQRGLNG